MLPVTKTPPAPSRAPSPAPEAARDRILDAAESLFAGGGLEAMSMRAVTRRAHVNLAAVNYHFGSKHQLVFAMVRRRFEPINARRMERLEAAVALARPGSARAWPAWDRRRADPGVQHRYFYNFSASSRPLAV